MEKINEFRGNLSLTNLNLTNMPSTKVSFVI